MLNTLGFKIEYTSQTNWPVSESVVFFQQKIVDSLWNTVKLELLSQIPSMALDTLMWEISPEERYTFDLNILRRMIEFVTLYDNNNKYSINLNPSTLIHPNFIKDMSQIFYERKITDYSQIDFEITENGYFNDDEIKVLNANIAYIQKLWIKIGIDDYPNMNNNNELLDRIANIDFVKIDKWFLLSYKDRDIPLDMLLRVFERHIRDIRARVWNVDIVVEWVENEELFLILKENFWDQITLFQWYHFS